MIERLYGVEHSIEAPWIFGGEEQIPASPSWELLFDLESLPQGTKVAIEYTPKFNRPFYVGETLALIPRPQRKYWQEIIQTCKTAKLDIVYLEDFPAFLEISRRRLQTAEILHEAQEAGPERKLELNRSLYRLDVETDYLYLFQRERTFLEKIQAAQPQIVIMGKGHTDFLITNRQEFSSRGITVACYQRETLSRPPSFICDLDKHVYGEILEDSSPDPQILIERNCLERKMRAVTEGRVTNGSPDFIGTWDVEIPARGLFEVYLDSGTIEDCLGTAMFVGEITPEKVDFTKGYLPDESSEAAYHDVINYYGGPVVGGYEGVYKVGREPERKFNLRKINS
ncbi:MAG: hypothetical protein UW61_C0032G0003 [Candidatus Curtissbacteria bacterium GW2011_GWC1_44_33]|uniref:Uncharacterized protein n=1 Tax=Candidatus Curtissbacteria bacterium GW2011_GWC1_44_33 TaxID=1618413 RepID=A0A0G1LBI2_9BACT|nr:MAG: hypothetical protein UW61_C0032G0003 [Candidatus Curtissbacteria bacterium GW2011_GWC1_44_33]